MKMGLKSALRRIKRTLLCCRKEDRKRSLDIGSPTDVRHMDVTEGMNLTKADAKMIREKASHDAIGLMSLCSHPPTQPSTPSGALVTDPFLSTSPSASASPLPHDPFASATASRSHLHTPSSSVRTRSPSQPLLTAATTNLPTSIPTPPRQRHNEASPPAFRVKSMWERTRRLSTRSRRSSIGYKGLDERKGDEGVVMLDFDFDVKDKDDAESGLSVEGFEVQGTTGGTPVGTPCKHKDKGNAPLIARAKNASELSDGSDSEMEVERKPLVKV